MGFDSIWISIISENQGEDYHGYAFLDHSKISKSSRILLLHTPIKVCGSWFDVVANHVAFIGTSYEKLLHLILPEHYHSYCEINNWWTNMYEIINCRIFGLPDLDRDHPFVRSTIQDRESYIIRITMLLASE